MKSLVKTVVLITGFSVLIRIFGFLFRIYLSRTLGAEALGLYQVAFSVFMVLMTIISSGLPFIISRMCASFRINGDKKKQGKLISSALILGVFESIAICGIVVLCQNLFKGLFADEACVWILLALLPALVFSSVYSVFRGALWGQDNYFALCVSEFFEQIVRILVCVLILVPTASNLTKAVGVAWSLTIACAVSAIFVVLLYFIYGGSLSKPGSEYKELVKRSTPITGVRVAGSLAQPLIALIVPLRLIGVGYTSSQAMALYGVAVGMTMPLLFVPTTLIGSLSTALVPDISMALVKEDKNHIESRIRSSIIFTIFVSALAVPLFVGAGELIGEFLFGNPLSGTILAGSAWIMIPMGLNNITSSLLNSLGYEIKSCMNYFIGATIMFVLIWFLPSICGINSLFWGMGVCMCVTSGLNFLMLKRKTGIKLKIFKSICFLVLITVPCSAIVSFVATLCSIVMPSVVAIILSCMVGGVFFVLLCMVFNVVDVKGYLNQLVSKFKINKKVKKST